MKRRSRRRLLVMVAVAVLALGLMTAGALTSGDDLGDAGSRSGSVPPAAQSDGPGPSASRSTPRTGQTWAGPTPPPIPMALRHGPEDAPVTIVEFGDYQCPSCGSFARDTKPELVRRYVDKGVVQLIWRDFPWIGDDSERAAVAARAAARQGQFWQYHDALFAKQFPENSGKLDDAYLRGLAERLGLDVTRFEADRKSKALREAVKADFGFAQRLGMSGTPAFLINGRPFFGDQPLDAFVKRIEQARRE